MVQIQTALIAGMEFTAKSGWRAHITLRDEMAKSLIRLAHCRKKPMVEIVREALKAHLHLHNNQILARQQVLI